MFRAISLHFISSLERTVERFVKDVRPVREPYLTMKYLIRPDTADGRNLAPPFLDGGGPIPSGNQTWLAGKSPMNGGFRRKFIDFYGPFSSTPCLITGG